jgi:pimeloyl-ACP methyl ester carboxylesterase
MHTQRYDFHGLDVPIQTWGSSSETLVFLTGLGIHPQHYWRGIHLLADRFRVVIPDLSFRSHRKLPSSPGDYLNLVTEVSRRFAPGAALVGHSFGALLALLHGGPAIACAPTIPTPVALPRMIGRAARQQLRAYLGLEGWYGCRYAAMVMTDYLRAAVTHPSIVFPIIQSLNQPSSAFQSQSQHAIVFQSSKDEFHRPEEYATYFGRNPTGVRIIPVLEYHDWPINCPQRLMERVNFAFDELS